MGILVDIKKKFDTFTLEVTFEIANETLALLGASGSGKSMTLKCIAGVETPDEGRIVLDGVVLFDSTLGVNLPPQQRGIGYLFQNYALFPAMTVEQNIQSAMKLPKKERKQLMQQKIKAFRLEGLEKKLPKELSGGEQQRVAIARMLAAEPKIIMLDEPFSALDSYLKWQLELEILEILESFEKPTLFVSHNRDEVYRIAHKIGIIEKGKLQKIGTKEELFKNPVTLSGARLTGCKNFSRIKRRSDHQVVALDWGIELTTEQVIEQVISREEPIYIGIRAHDIELVALCGSLQSMNIENYSLGEAPILTCKIVKIIENTYTYMLKLEIVLDGYIHSHTHNDDGDQKEVEFIKSKNTLDFLWLEKDKQGLESPLRTGNLIHIRMDPRKFLLVTV